MYWRRGLALDKTGENCAGWVCRACTFIGRVDNVKNEKMTNFDKTKKVEKVAKGE